MYKSKKLILLGYLFLIIGLVEPAFAQREIEVKLADEYYQKGELEKALSLYESLEKNYRYIPQIHNNYLSLLLDLKKFDYAHKYLTNVLKRFPGNIYYVLDRGLIYREEGDLDEMDKYFKKLIRDEIREDNYKSRVTAQYFVNHQLIEYSVVTYLAAREFSGLPSAYSFELANIYRMTNAKDKMVAEYIIYLSENPSNLQYVRNTLQMVLTEPEELEQLETLLYQKIQVEPENETYNELLIWVNLQQKNFNGAFVQARALDRRSGTAGDRAMNIGIIALQNEDYEAAARIFDYIVNQYPVTGNSIVARHYRIKAEEEIVKKTFPVNIEKIRNLSNKYQDFINEIGLEPTTLDAYRNKALLHAFYLDEKDSAISILKEIILHRKAGRELIARSKLDLGDIYILTNESWESTLLYSQVEKSMKETPTGYDAKLRNAKLSYFNGDFRLAQEHLDILKEATTREISNDAMRLSLLIRDNTGMDSTEEAMKEYAAIELLLFQNKTEEAKARIDAMITTYPAHSLVDELLWMKADVFRKEGNFVAALELLERIEKEYFNDILGDDAYYLSGVIYEENQLDTARAMEIFNDFLTRYPGSVYAADARKRYRTLRGDFVIDETNPVN